MTEGGALFTWGKGEEDSSDDAGSQCVEFIFKVTVAGGL